MNTYAGRKSEMIHYVAKELKSGGWHYTMNSLPIGYCLEHGGHDTAEEARECYKSYMLDKHLHLDRKISDDILMKCKVKGCEEFTSGFASVGGYSMFILCDKHRTREEVERLYSVGESWES